MKSTTTNALGFAVLTGLAAGTFTEDADASPIQTPQLVEGKHVYKVPEAFTPPQIDQVVIDDLEKAIKGFHHQFYVVLLQKFDGPSDNAQMNQAFAKSVDALADGLVKQYPAQFNNSSTLFVKAFNPNKYATWIGTDWKKIGINTPQERSQFDGFYLKFAKENPPNISSGIGNIGKQLDLYWYTHTDSEFLRKKAERERIATEKKAETERAEAERKAEAEERRKVYQARLDAENERKLKEAALPVGIVGAAVLLFALIRRRNKKGTETVADFNREAIDFEIKIDAARQHLAELNRNRDAMNLLRSNELKQTADDGAEHAKKSEGGTHSPYRAVGLNDELAGDTQLLFDELAAGFDKISIGLAALEKHLKACRKLAQKAGFFDVKPAQQASLMLDDEVVYQVEDLNLDPAQFFTPHEGEIKFFPNKFFREEEKIYQKAMQSLPELRQAVEQQQTDPKKFFPRDQYAALLETIEHAKIPSHWLKAHPLHGEGTEAELYAQLEELRWSDAVKYGRSAKELQAREQNVVAMMAKITQLLDELRKVEDAQLKVPDGTVVGSSDDPQRTLELAKRLAVEFRGLLATKDNLQEIEHKAAEATQHLRTATDQLLAIEKAITSAGRTVEVAQAAKKAIPAQETITAKALAEASRKHLKIKLPSMETAKTLEKTGDAVLERAIKLLSEQKHLEAAAAAGQSLNLFNSSKQNLEQIVSRCRELDRLKGEFSQIYTQLSPAHQAAAEQIKKYGVEQTLKNYSPITGPDVAEDYKASISQANTLLTEWKTAVEAAKKVYEKRIKDEEDDRRRQENASSSSSSINSNDSSNSVSDTTNSSVGDG